MANAAHIELAHESTEAIRTVVLLGASNLRIGLRKVVQCIRERIPGPLHLNFACGHGRSYGLWSSIPFRALPGIIQSGLWEELSLPSSRSGPRTLALITDVGNDLLYGVEPPQILAWVAECVERLKQRDANLVVTLPPERRLQKLSNAGFLLTRTLLFSRSTLTRAEMLRNVEELRAGLIQVAEAAGAAVVDPELQWYGLDPIHIRWGQRGAAWRAIVSAWQNAADFPKAAEATSLTKPPGLAVRWKRPRCRRFLGRMQETPQPCYSTPGLEISFY